jgi:hypothetical protein
MSAVNLDDAVSILGADHVITMNDAARVWNKAGIDLPVRYAKATLVQAAEENQARCNCWKLLYIFGNSLLYQALRFGTDRTKNPCFNKAIWWDSPREDFWAAKKVESGYYLIDCKGLFINRSWDDQEAEIRNLGARYRRADLNVMCEGTLSNYAVNQRWLFAKHSRWSGVADSRGQFVYVFVNSGGITLARRNREESKQVSGVCLFNEFDF